MEIGGCSQRIGHILAIQNKHNNISEVYITFDIWSRLVETCNQDFHSLCAIWHAQGPNVLNEGLPALEDKTFSETLAKHLDALHAARKAFTQSENSERIRNALRKKVCTNNTVYHNGDLVW